MLRYLVLGLWGLCVPLLAIAAPVDTNQFGFIREGMSEASVVSRVGPPDDRQVLRRYAKTRRVAHGVLADYHEEVVLFYQGDEQTMHTYIFLDNGIVTTKDKKR
mgnify:CR=1 FL=1